MSSKSSGRVAGGMSSVRSVGDRARSTTEASARGRVVDLDGLGGGGVVVDRADRCVDEGVDQRALALLELADDEDRAGRLLEASPGGGHAGVEVGPVAAAQQRAEGVDADEGACRGPVGPAVDGAGPAEAGRGAAGPEGRVCGVVTGCTSSGPAAGRPLVSQGYPSRSGAGTRGSPGCSPPCGATQRSSASSVVLDQLSRATSLSSPQTSTSLSSTAST